LPAKPVARWRWAIHLLLLAALPLMAGFMPLAKPKAGPMLSSTVPGLLRVCGVEILALAVPLALAWLFSRATKDQLLLRWRPGFWVVPLGFAYSFAIRISAVIVTGFILAMIVHDMPGADARAYALEHRPKVEKLLDIHALSADPVYYWLNVVLVSFVIGGLREEIWRGSLLAGLRGIWPRGFTSFGGEIAAVGVASLLFGIGHLPQGVLAAGGITVVGFGLGLIMIYHRSIWPSVVAHGFFDAASIAILPWAMEQMQHLPQPPA
jgi:membrane protease YdiL (CAAX protease family)